MTLLAAAILISALITAGLFVWFMLTKNAQADGYGFDVTRPPTTGAATAPAESMSLMNFPGA